ncbi:hypothetical protein SIO70_10140 [Chitinophaga sancti]|uniref:hypothetical protein n=1 Tax=Chitinophaga sancti TaxID=1004 RepID=UPI002A74EA5E|nr:hypothetical protein [Chitinophaga sancti]WPQ65203.1 hypothetical protein SIO70_10140 [Chitinophaga sancti]
MESKTEEFLKILGDKIKHPHDWNSKILSVTNFDNDTYNRLSNLLQELRIQEDGDKDEIFFNLNKDAGPSNLVFYDQVHFQSENSYVRYKDCWQEVNIILLMPGGEMVIKENPHEPNSQTTMKMVVPSTKVLPWNNHISVLNRL